MLSKISRIFPLRGVLLCVVGAWLSFACAHFFPSFGKVSFALVIGMAFRAIFQWGPQVNAAMTSASKSFLSLSIILLGFALKFSAIWNLGVSSLVLVCAIVLLSLLVAALVSRLASFDREMSLLVGIGAGICGSSAIATTSVTITNDRSKVATALGAINCVGLLGLFGLPFLLHLFQANEAQAALVLGGSLQSLGHVAAAAGLLGADVVKQALTVKLARVFLLVPTFLFFAHRASKKNHEQKRMALPVYLWGFLISAGLSAVEVFPKNVTSLLSEVSSLALLCAVVGIGYEIQLKTLFKAAPRYLLLSLGIQILQLILIIAFCILVG